MPVKSSLLRLLGSCALTLLTACDTLGLAALNAGAAPGEYEITIAAYGPDALQKLDIYVPKGAAPAPRDVIVFFYGGRWETGSKEQYRFIAARFVERGFIVVIPDYRKYPAVRFPVFVQDAAKAVAWTHDHIAEHGGNPARLHIAGHSAGAHIASLAVTDERYLAAVGKSAPQIIVDFAGLAGPYDFTPDEPDLIDMFGPPANYPQMQATTFIDGGEPPMLLLRGLDDEVVGAINHEHLAERIRAHHGRVEIRQYPKLGHIGILSTFSRLGPKSDVVDDMVRFFREDHTHG